MGHSKRPRKLKSSQDNEITVPDSVGCYHYIYNKKFDTDVYIMNTDSQLIIGWRGTELTSEDGFDKDDVLQDAKFFTGNPPCFDPSLMWPPLIWPPPWFDPLREFPLIQWLRVIPVNPKTVRRFHELVCHLTNLLDSDPNSVDHPVLPACLGRETLISHCQFGNHLFGKSEDYNNFAVDYLNYCLGTRGRLKNLLSSSSVPHRQNYAHYKNVVVTTYITKQFQNAYYSNVYYR